MRTSRWSLACAALTLVSCATARPPEAPTDGKVRVQGVAEFTVPWCAGMAPPDGDGSRTLPDANATFVVKPGRENSETAPLTTVRTDASGRLDFELPLGTWCLVASSRAPTRPSRTLAEATAPRLGGDVQCADALWLQCEAIIDGSRGGVTQVRVQRFEHCSWNQPCQAPGPAPP